MVRIIDGIPINPLFIGFGWILAAGIITIIVRLNPEFNTSEVAEDASLGAFLFLLQSIFFPIKILPVFLTLSGVPLVITIKGVKRGLVIASSAIILNHLFIPGAISMLPINLSNMLIAGLIAGIIPSRVYRRRGRRIRYLSGFLGGVIYFIVLSLMIFLEISVSVAVTSEIPRQLLVQLFTFGVLIVGTLEGLLTAIVSSYYYSRRKRSYTGVRHSPVVQYEDISFTDLGVGRPEDILITDIKGSTGSLDPRSKILITLFFILGTAISLDYFQVFLYLLIYIPILILFRPRLVFFKRLIFPFILILFVSFVLYLGIEGSEVPINIFNYQRTYTKEGFIGLIIYRYMTIILFNFMLLHSEPSHTDIIEALASFRLGTSIITILLLIKRISTTVSSDLAKMSFAAQSKGAFGKNPARNIFVRMQILGRTLVRSVSHSESISKSLIARGFHDNFVPTIRPWSSEGVSVTILSGILCVCITVIPWLR